MKKMMFLVPVAALAMASCSNESIVDEQSVAKLNAESAGLVIRPMVNGTTRGTVTTSANLSEFKVLINGSFQKGAEWQETPTTSLTDFWETLSGNGSSWAFTKASADGGLGDGEKYWWNNATTPATFTAFAPATTTLTSDSKAVDDFVPDATVASQVDLITAYNSGSRDDFKNGVPLNFKHALSQILAQANNADNSKVKIEVAGIRFRDIISQGDLTLPTSTATAGTWALATGTTANYNAGNAAAAVTTGITELGQANGYLGNLSSSPMLLLPQDLSASSKSPAISILVRITDLSKKVAYKDASGHFYAAKADGSRGDMIAFNADESGYQATENDADRYLGIVNKGEESEVVLFDKTTNADQWTLKSWNGTEAGEAVNLYMVNEVIYPREGRGNQSTKFAYVYTTIKDSWEMGYKYTYTLNFADKSYGNVEDYTAEGYGFAVSDAATTAYPVGLTDYDPIDGTIDPLEPDEPVEENNEVELKFATVTVDEWQNGTADEPAL